MYLEDSSYNTCIILQVRLQDNQPLGPEYPRILPLDDRTTLRVLNHSGRWHAAPNFLE